MILKNKITNINGESISQIFFLLALIFMFFPVRYVFFTKEAVALGIYSDFTSFSLYLSDIFLLLAFLFILPRGVKVFFKSWYLFLAYLSIIIAFIIKIPHINETNWYFLIKFTEFFFVAYGTSRFLLQNTNFKGKIIKIFVILGSLQSILGICQFYAQKSLGLKRLGEQILDPRIHGLAKIELNKEVFLRAYGTFPHSNLLSVFLFTTLILNIYLFVKAKSKTHQGILGFLLALNSLGLTLAFSRAAYLATVVGLALILIIFLYFKEFSKKLVLCFIILGLSAIVIFFSFKPFIFTRATITDNAVSDRVFYGNVGTIMLKNNLFTGVGLGQSIINMTKYSPVRLLPMQIQPIHNYFLIAATEIGILGAFLLLILFLIHVKQLIVLIINSQVGDRDLMIFLLSVFLGYLVLMQFDHYFYTLQQTQLLLWIILGMIASEKITKNI